MREPKTAGFRWLPSYYEALRDLPDQDRLQVYDAVLDYGFGNGAAELPPHLRPFFILMAPSIKKSASFEEKQQENGKKGGRPSKAKAENLENPNGGTGKPSSTSGFPSTKNLAIAVDLALDNALEGDGEKILADKPPSPPAFPFEDYLDVWKRCCPSLPCPKDPATWTETRKRRLKDKDLSLERWEEVCNRIEASDFLTGRKDGKWSASFDWIIKPENWVKVMEGNYDNRDKRQKIFTSAEDPEEPMFDILDEVIN